MLVSGQIYIIWVIVLGRTNATSSRVPVEGEIISVCDVFEI